MNIPPWPNYSAEEAEIVQRVLLSNKVNYWTGREAREFECEYSQYFEADYAIALANGTVALDLALKALGVGPGDEVIVTPRSFIASASAVVNSGAKAVFADVDRDSQNITAETISRVLSPRTRAIICVHLAGWPCEMNDILSLAESHNIFVIEDCAQAHGAKYHERSVGTFGQVGAWSFCQDKIMTTAGEGGMVTTNDQTLHDFMWSFKDHGKDYKKAHTPPTSTKFRYMHDSIGTNWRLTEMQAAIGRYQLTRMPDWSAARKRNGRFLNESLSEINGLRVPVVPVDSEHAYYKFYLFIEPHALSASWDRDRIVAEVHSLGTPCFTGSCPEIYREKAFSDLYSELPVLPMAAELGRNSIMLNVHPGIERYHLENYTNHIRAVLSDAVL